MTQQQNEPELPDGERLDKLKREQRYTWAEIAKDIGVSTSMIHMVRRGEKRLGREPSSQLSRIEAAGRTAAGNSGAPESKPISYGALEIRESPENHAGSADQLRAEVADLRRQLVQANATIASLSRTIEAMQQGRAPGAAPAVPASGALYTTRKAKTG